MTQPRRIIGPPNVGGQADNGGSQPATGANFRKLQRHARGLAEWIDAAPTGTGQALAQAHDHRGGTYGRPLGSVTTAQFYSRIGAGFATSLWADGMFMVPDCSPVGGLELRNPADNGGFMAPRFWLYAESAVPVALTVNLSITQVGARQNNVFAGLVFSHPGGGKAWLSASDQIVLPVGLIKITAAVAISAATAIEQLALEVPH